MCCIFSVNCVGQLREAASAAIGTTTQYTTPQGRNYHELRTFFPLAPTAAARMGENEVCAQGFFCCGFAHKRLHASVTSHFVYNYAYFLDFFIEKTTEAKKKLKVANNKVFPVRSKLEHSFRYSKIRKGQQQQRE